MRWPDLQPRQRALGDPGRRGQLGQRHAPLGPHPLEPGADLGQHGRRSPVRSPSRPVEHAIPGNGNEVVRPSAEAHARAGGDRHGRTTTYDVVIVGGGAAGLSAALVLGRARRRVAVIDAGAPRNAPAAHMQGFLSRDGMPPAELLAAGRAEVAGYGVELIDDRGRSTIEPGFARPPRRRPDASTARRILVATGVGDELPDIPGVRERWGRDLLHCPYCHGWEVRDQPLGVLGTTRLGPARPARPAVVRRRRLLRPHARPSTDGERAELEARGIRVVDGRGRPARRRGRPPDRGRARRRPGHRADRGVHPAGATRPTPTGCSPASAASSTRPASSPSTPPAAPARPASGRPATSSTRAPR